MFKRLLLVATAFVFASDANTAPVPELTSATPFLVARIQPIDKLFDDAKFLVSKFGKPEAAAKFEASVLHQLGVDSLADTGIDTKKPSGMYVFLQNELADSTVVAMLPVANSKAVLDFVGKYEAKAEKIEDEFYSIALPEMSLPVFVRFANGYAYVTAANKAAVSPASILAPERVFVNGDKSMLSVTVHPEQVPESLRKVVLAQISDSLKDLESDEDEYPEVSRFEAKSLTRWIESIAEHGRELTFQANYDRPSGELTFDFGVAPKKGTKLAQEISETKPGSSLFTKMLGDRGAINYAINTVASHEDAKEMADLVNESGCEVIMDMFELDGSDEAIKAEVSKFCQVLAPSLEAGVFDVAMTIRPSGDQHIALLGLRLKDGKKVEEAMRKLVAAFPEDTRKKFKLDAQTIGEIKLHKFELEEVDEFFERFFGKSPLWLAMKDNALVLGVGVDAEKAVADGLANAEPKPAPNFQIDVSVKKLKAFCDAVHDGMHGQIVQAFGEGVDRARILAATVEGGDQLKTRLSVNLQLIAGIGISTGEMFGIPMPVIVPAMPQGGGQPAPQQPPAE